MYVPYLSSWNNLPDVATRMKFQALTLNATESQKPTDESGGLLENKKCETTKRPTLGWIPTLCENFGAEEGLNDTPPNPWTGPLLSWANIVFFFFLIYTNSYIRS